MKAAFNTINHLFTPDYARYDGVRPANVYLLRLFYALMFVFVGMDSWMYILGHEGPWNPMAAVAWCVWAAYSALAGLGVLYPLRMLPIFLFMIFYKTLWLLVVAYPLWSAGELSGSPAEGMTRIFMWAPLTALVVPWGYVFHTYVIGRKPVERCT